MAFQIIDDTLDYCSENNDFGKNIGDDFKEGKVTIPIILAYTRSTKKEKGFWLKVINDKNQSSEDLSEALNIIKKYDTIRDCFEKARHFSLMAKDSLGPFENGFEKQQLINLADFSVKRAY